MIAQMACVSVRISHEWLDCEGESRQRVFISRALPYCRMPFELLLQCFAKHNKALGRCSHGRFGCVTGHPLPGAALLPARVPVFLVYAWAYVSLSLPESLRHVGSVGGIRSEGAFIWPDEHIRGYAERRAQGFHLVDCQLSSAREDQRQ